MLQEYKSREQASIAAADQISAALERRLQQAAKTRLIVTGGSSPQQCYAHLAKAPVDWSQVQVLLSDERWVPADHADSNERMLREHLFVGPVRDADFLPMYAADMSLAERSDYVSRLLAKTDVATACALLGMGDDGHFASLFPDAGNLAIGLRATSSTCCIPVTTAASPHPRISLTLGALLRSDEIVLLCFGDAKRAVLERAGRDDDQFPVSHLLRQTRVPVTVFWAP